MTVLFENIGGKFGHFRAFYETRFERERAEKTPKCI